MPGDDPADDRRLATHRGAGASKDLRTIGTAKHPAPREFDEQRRITGGRYTSAIVNGDLDVQVEIKETGQLKPADELSRATKDQLFLVERLEIARLLAPTNGQAPLLLDDPFAHYDRTRLRRGLEILADVAEERQVIVFSEDSDLITLARTLRPTTVVIALASPNRSVREQDDADRRAA